MDARRNHGTDTDLIPRLGRVVGDRRRQAPGSTLARTQGVFNIVAGVWPVLHRRSFEAVLGPKADYWLVNTVAALLIANGVVQAAAPASEDGVAAARRIGLGTASALALIDLMYVPAGRISRAYLLDAVCESGWIAAWLRQPRTASGP